MSQLITQCFSVISDHIFVSRMNCLNRENIILILFYPFLFLYFSYLDVFQYVALCNRIPILSTDFARVQLEFDVSVMTKWLVYRRYSKSLLCIRMIDKRRSLIRDTYSTHLTRDHRFSLQAHYLIHTPYWRINFDVYSKRESSIIWKLNQPLLNPWMKWRTKLKNDQNDFP